MKISVTSYSFSQYIKSGKIKVEDCVCLAKELGFDGIEFIGLGCATQGERLALAEKIRKSAEEKGIDMVAYAVGAALYQPTVRARRREVKRLKDEVDVAYALGVSVMRHDATFNYYPDKNGRSFDLMLPAMVRSAREITRYAKRFGIRTCTENHGFIAQDSDRMERLFTAVGEENYGLLIDIGNFLCVDESPESAVSRLAPYAIHVHAKDFCRPDSPEEGFLSRGANPLIGVAVGEGIVPVKKCLEILKKAGYDGYVTIEYEGKEDCIEGLRKAKRNVENMLKALK